MGVDTDKEKIWLADPKNWLNDDYALKQFKVRKKPRILLAAQKRRLKEKSIEANLKKNGRNRLFGINRFLRSLTRR